MDKSKKLIGSIVVVALAILSLFGVNYSGDTEDLINDLNANWDCANSTYREVSKYYDIVSNKHYDQVDITLIPAEIQNAKDCYDKNKKTFDDIQKGLYR